MPPGYFAKTVITSSLLTLVIVFGLLITLRYALVDWIVGAIPQNTTSIVEQNVVVTHDEQIIDVIEKANRSVVSVIAVKEVPVYERFYEPFSPFGDFFGRSNEFMVPRQRQQGTEERVVGGGSGFIVSESGLIVTNKHVVSDTNARYSVTFYNGDIADVTVLARDDVLDVAILQVEDTEEIYEYLTFGDSDTLRLGQTVIAIGNALAEFNNTVSTGIISGLSRTIEARGRLGAVEQLDQVIQTDAAINPGNSGGPLLNIRGEVIGVNVATSIGADNIGFALPAKVIEQIVLSVVEIGIIERPFLGVRYTEVNSRLALELDLGVDYGAKIISSMNPDAPSVLPGSAADIAGIKEGDIIIAVDDRLLKDVSLAQVLRGKNVGQTISITVFRDGKNLKLEAELQVAP